MLGDCAWGWPNNEKTDLFHVKVLQERKIPILCVFGNHENYSHILSCPLVDIGIGEQVYWVYDGVYYLQRGKLYNIDGHKCLVLGGALSIDKQFRRKFISWWPQEYWTDEEKIELINLLENVSTFDFVFSHTGPNSINNQMFVGIPGMREKFFDDVAIFYDDFLKTINFKTWFMGHWHEFANWEHPYYKKQFVGLYKDVALIKDDKEVVLHPESVIKSS